MNNEKRKIRQYRRLRRKAKRLKSRRSIGKFILNKLIPFAIIQLLLKKIKFSWLSFGIFF